MLHADRKVRILIHTALMAALVFIATWAVKIPIPAAGGYVHPGDALVLLAGITLGPLWGGLAAGIGSALADLLGGYVVYVPATLIIKGAVAALAAGLTREWNGERHHNAIVTAFYCAPAECMMVTLYYWFEALVLGYGIAAAGEIIPNLIQGAAGVVFTALLLPVVRKIVRVTQSE